MNTNLYAIEIAEYNTGNKILLSDTTSGQVILFADENSVMLFTQQHQINPRDYKIVLVINQLN